MNPESLIVQETGYQVSKRRLLSVYASILGIYIWYIKRVTGGAAPPGRINFDQAGSPSGDPSFTDSTVCSLPNACCIPRPYGSKYLVVHSRGHQNQFPREE